MGDRAEVFDQLGLGHADPEVLDRQGFGLVVGRDVDLQLQLVVEDLLFGQLEMPELLQRVGGIGDQFADEDLLLGVKRVDDDIEQLLDLSLELKGLRFGHGDKDRRKLYFSKVAEKSRERFPLPGS